MSLTFLTNDANGLLRAFNKAISQKEQKGKVETWHKYSDTEIFTHMADRWKTKAWMKATPTKDSLVFNILPSKEGKVEPEVYSYYHGHLMETFLNHFTTQFSSAVVTAKAASGDRLS